MRSSRSSLVMVAIREDDTHRQLAARVGGIAEVRPIESRSAVSLVLEVTQAQPEVLVLELSAVAQAAPDIVDALKCVCPTTLIIIHSPNPHDEDAAVVERGIYFYAAGASAETLADAVHAALSRKRRERA